MKKLIKIVLGLVGLVVLLLAVAAVVLPMVYDTEDLKRTLEAQVEKRTGRELQIAGDLDFSVFPWLALEVSDLSLGNTPRFGEGAMARIGEARAGVALMPLLRKEIYIDEVLLTGLQLDLVVDENGTSNWEDLAGGADETPADDGGAFAAQQIAGLNIQDAQIAFRDEQAGTAYRVTDFDLKTGALGGSSPLPIDLAMHVEDLAAGTAMDLALNAVVALDLASQVHTLDELSLELRQSGGPALELTAAHAVADLNNEVYTFETLETVIDQDGQRIELAAPDMRADLAGQTLELVDFTAQALGLDITGSLGAQNILGEPAFAGNLQIPEFSPAALMQALDMEVPPTADPNVLQSASLAADFDGGLDRISLTGLNMVLDDSKIEGRLSMRHFEQPQIRFDFDVDRIDLDRYMAPAEESTAPGGEEDVAIPGEELKGMDVQGTLRVAELRAMGLDLTDAEVGLKVADNALRLHPLQAGFYGGTYSGDIRLDASGEVPVVSLNESIEAVIFQQLAGDLLGQDTLSGAGFGHIQLTGRGNTTGELLSSLAGNVGLRLDEGALEGVDVWHEIRSAMAKFKGQPAPEGGENRTVFSRMNLNATVADGVMNLDELLGQLPFLDLSGGGSIDLARQALDLDLLAAVSSAPELSQDPLTAGLEGKKLPFSISGSLADPKIGIDVGELLMGEATDLLLDKLGVSAADQDGDGETSTEEAALGLLSGLLGGDDDEDEAAPQEQQAPATQAQRTASEPAAQPQAAQPAREEADAAATAAEKEAAKQARQEARRKARQEQRTKEKEEQEKDEGG